MAKKRRMTVDELLGPELTAELGIEQREGADAPPPSEAPTEVLKADKPAAAKEPEPIPEDEMATAPGPPDDDFGEGFEEQEGLRTAVMDKPALDQLKSELAGESAANAETPAPAKTGPPEADDGAKGQKESSAGKPVPAPIKPPGSEDAGRPARVPLPPAPGQPPITRGRIPSITPKREKSKEEAAPAPQPADGFDSEGLETRIDFKVPDFTKEPPTDAAGAPPEASTPGWPDVIPEASTPAPPPETPAERADPANPFNQNIPADQTVQLQLGDLQPRADLSSPGVSPPADVDMPTAPLPVEDSEVSVPSPGAVPRFPREEARIFSSALKLWARKLPMPYKIAGIAVPIIVVLGFILLLVLLAVPSTEEAYLVADHSILAIPSTAESVYSSIGVLARNERVQVLDRIGTFVLVRDPEGRVGWVQESYLAEDVPPIGPDLEFTRCFRRTNEETVNPCKERALFQAERCMEHCAGLDNPTPCQVDCQEHLTKCENNCSFTLRELRAAATPEPPPDEAAPTEVATEDGPVEEEAAVEAEEEPAPVEEEEPPKKKKKKKKKRKKKKKKR